VDLAEWLLDRIAEVERWYTRDRNEEAARMRQHGYIASGGGWDQRPYSWQRGLAGCEAKRRLVELHRPDPKPEHDNGWGTIHDADGHFLGYRTDLCEEDGEMLPCPTLRLLALPFADRPGYQEEWRP